ncbi:MAG: isopenicillin N synthase family dioxygenase [Lautropia sp.]
MPDGRGPVRAAAMSAAIDEAMLSVIRAPKARASALDLATDEVPILDLGPYLAGEPGALDAVARDLLHASTHVGFYFLANHGVPQTLIDQVFRESARFHALPQAEKEKLKLDKNKIGYFGSGTTGGRRPGIKPNLYSAFCVREDLAPDDPDVVAGKPFRGLNQWPANLPGFRETVMAYCHAVRDLCRGILPIYARALDLPLDFFDAAFVKPLLNMQLNHYERQAVFDGDQFGIAPHTDRTFITLLCQAQVPGLEIQPSGGRWVTAPALPGHFLVNTGDLLRLWTNERFLSTPHRVINTSGVERHSIPFFFNPDPDTLIECLPTCRSASEPAKHPPLRYIDFYEWFVRRGYPDIASAIAAKQAADAGSAR